MSPCNGRATRWAKQVLWKKWRCSNNWRASLLFTMATRPTRDYGIGLRHALTSTVLHALNPPGPITDCRWQPASRSTVAARWPARTPPAAPWVILPLCANKRCFCFLAISKTRILPNNVWRCGVVKGQTLWNKKKKKKLVIVVKQSLGAAGRQARS